MVATVALVLGALGTPAPASATGLLVVGDVGTGGDAQIELGEAVREYAERNPAELLVTLGDNDYTDDPAAFRRNWEASFGWLDAKGIGVAGALGDHDTEGPDDGRYELPVLEMPGPYYTRRIDDVELFVLDASSRARIDDEQVAWLQGALEASTARWKIAVVHRGPYTCGRYEGSREVLGRFAPLFDRYGVQLVLSGDDHVYERFAPVNGVTYVVHGAAAERTYELSRCPFGYPQRLAASTERGFLYLNVDGVRLEATAVSSDGVPLDRFVLIEDVKYADTGDIGFEDRSFAGARRSPSGSKPESKLWWNDGSWWGSLYDAASGDFLIHRLDLETQEWQSTGVLVDARIRSRSDTLWDGEHLYIATHFTTEIAQAGEPSLLLRFSYDRKRKTYTLDEGFPTVINNTTSETLVIDRDSRGRIWATWTQDGEVYVNHTVRKGLAWAAPSVLPVEDPQVERDISAVIAFGGDRIGVFWGNHDETGGTYNFAVHRDAAPPREWGPVERIDLLGSADDHLNLKAGADGTVYAAVKATAKEAADVLVSLLVRDPDTGAWSSHPFGRVSDGHTRPILVLDEEHDTVRLFATGPLSPAREGTVYEKQASLADLAFEPGEGRPVMRDAEQPDLNDPTSTKQAVSSETGLVVLASNNLTDRYWHHYDSLRTDPFATGAATEVGEESAPAPTASAGAEPDAPVADATTFVSAFVGARPVLLVAVGIPLWLVAISALRRRRRAAFLGAYAVGVAAATVTAIVALAAALL